MRVGYARVSTTEQSIEAQLERLADCERVFQEKLSGAKTDRPQLQAALEFVREGDVVVATRLDRLARSVSHLCRIADTLRKKRVELVILDQAIDTSTPTGKFLFHMLAAVAEFELTIRLEASRAGMAHAKAMGKRSGRLPALVAAQAHDMYESWKRGVKPKELARDYHVSLPTFYRYLDLEKQLQEGLPESHLENSSETPISALS